MLYNPKTKQTIIQRSFTKLESSDPIIPSLTLSILAINSELFLRPLFPSFLQIFSLRHNVYQNQKLQLPSHEVPYLSRSRSLRPPPQGHIVTPTATFNDSSNSHNHLSSTGVIVPSVSHITPTSHICQPSNIFSPLPTNSVSSFPTNMHIPNPRSFHYGNCPLFLLIFLYLVLLLTNLLTILVMFFRNSSSNS